MFTRMAPDTRSRVRWAVSASACMAAIVALLAFASPAIAADKSPEQAGQAATASPGKSAEAPGQADKAEKKEEKASGKPESKANPAGSPASAGGGAASAGKAETKPQKSQGGVAPGESKQDRGPNKPVSDKYNGPCERHEDTHLKGPGHDWHRGYGKGHDLREPDGDQPDDGGPVTPPDTDTGEPDEGTGEPDDPAGPPDDSTPDEDTPGPRVPADEPEDPNGGAPSEEPFLPFSPTPVAVTTTTTTTVVESTAFLPYTGGESGLLLVLAAGFGLAGSRLRRYGRARLHSHRRIAR